MYKKSTYFLQIICTFTAKKYASDYELKIAIIVIFKLVLWIIITKNKYY